MVLSHPTILFLFSSCRYNSFWKSWMVNSLRYYTISLCSLYMSLMENFFQIGVNLKIVKIICFFFLNFFHWYPALDLIILKFSLYTTLEDIEYHNPMLKTYMILSKCAPNLYNELDAHYCRLFFVLKTWLLVPFGKQWIQGSPIWKQ